MRVVLQTRVVFHGELTYNDRHRYCFVVHDPADKTRAMLLMTGACHQHIHFHVVVLSGRVHERTLRVKPAVLRWFGWQS